MHCKILGEILHDGENINKIIYIFVSGEFFLSTFFSLNFQSWRRS